MSSNARLSDKEYEELSIRYEQNPPDLSGKPGFLTSVREKTEDYNVANDAESHTGVKRYCRKSLKPVE